MKTEKLTFPLYHGTSTLFLDDIKKEGLGGTNIVDKYDLITPLKKLHSIEKKYREDWKYFDYIDDIIKQKSEGANFQHGQVYLSPSYRTAFRYATSNKYGSEILSIIIDLYHKVIERGISFEFENIFIKSILDKEYSSILIEVSDIPVEYLLTENGESDVKYDIEEILEYGAEECEQTNFRLSKVIPVEKFKIITDIESAF